MKKFNDQKFRHEYDFRKRPHPGWPGEPDDPYKFKEGEQHFYYKDVRWQNYKLAGNIQAEYSNRTLTQRAD